MFWKTSFEYLFQQFELGPVVKYFGPWEWSRMIESLPLLIFYHPIHVILQVNSLASAHRIKPFAHSSCIIGLAIFFRKLPNLGYKFAQFLRIINDVVFLINKRICMWNTFSIFNVSLARPLNLMASIPKVHCVRMSISKGASFQFSSIHVIDNWFKSTVNIFDNLIPIFSIF